MTETIFSKILRREVPADIVYETESVLAFRDINPQAPTHILIIPKKVIVTVSDTNDDDTHLLGQLLRAAAAVAEEQGFAANGYRLVVNNGSDGGQEVPHLHVHLLAGRKMKWPPG